MALIQSLTPQVTIDAAEDYVVVLCNKIFSARHLKEVEKEIWLANKIKLGLRALNRLQTTDTAYSQIIIGLNKAVPVYKQTLYQKITI